MAGDVARAQAALDLRDRRRANGGNVSGHRWTSQEARAAALIAARRRTRKPKPPPKGRYRHPPDVTERCGMATTRNQHGPFRRRAWR